MTIGIIPPFCCSSVKLFLKGNQADITILSGVVKKVQGGNSSYARIGFLGMFFDDTLFDKRILDSLFGKSADSVLGQFLPYNLPIYVVWSIVSKAVKYCWEDIHCST